MFRFHAPQNEAGPLDAPHAPLVESELVGGRYLLQERLAAGGMGVVWRAHDRARGQDLALKRLHAASAGAFEVHALQREYQVLNGIHHPRIIRVFDYGQDDRGPYYTMELLGGSDLRAIAPVDFRTAASYLRDLATSLGLLHARHFVHRDLSPGNVRVTPDGHCKLLDFGALAPFGVARVIVGTAPFVPPEAMRGEPLDQRSDLYALGALAYWTISGRHAYPAKSLNELPRRWRAVPVALSALVPEVPEALNALVMSLLSAEPRARPGSTAEVIAVLTSLADLPPETLEDASELLSSFLTNPRFVGRTEELARIAEAIGAAASHGAGCALHFAASPGMGRTRLLEEAALRAQLAGAAVVRIDASPKALGSALEHIALRLLEAAPGLAGREARPFDRALADLGRQLVTHVAGSPVESGEHEPTNDVRSTKAIEEWIVAISRQVPLVLLVDNVESADAASLALLSCLAQRAPLLALVVMATERLSSDESSLGLQTLRSKCETRRLAGLSVVETLDLARSLFGGEATNVERFAGWLHRQTAGSPLFFLELVRQLSARQLVRHVDGLWVLPQERPRAALPERLDTALAQRIDELTGEARRLCGRLALHRLQLEYRLCRELLPTESEEGVSAALSELVARGYLVCEGAGFTFASTALHDATIQGVPEFERLENHRELGAALMRSAARDDHQMQMEAGWHLMQGGLESEGADLIMRVTCNSLVVRRMVANLHHVGRTVAAALEIYQRQRRGPYERMPLLGALAHIAFYENFSWGERYGDQALDVLQDISGLATASRLRRWLGRPLALVVGLCSALMRFWLTPERERPYSFSDVITQLLGAATTLTGSAASSLDADRADRVAAVLEPFAVLPERLTPVGIYQFCRGLQQIAREHQADATATFERLLERFRDPHYYPTLPKDARLLYQAGLLYAIGAFDIFRAYSQRALEVARELDASGLKLYAMVASQLRYLYHINRGEVELAAPHREQVELHAVQVGSAAQVERWESPALLPLCIVTHDVVGGARAVQRLTMDASAPYLRRYRRLAESAMATTVDPAKSIDRQEHLIRELSERTPRDFIGWAMTSSSIARALLAVGAAARAEAWCIASLQHVCDADREYVVLFLDLDVQLAHAQAALGRHTEALARLDGLIVRFTPSGHPLALGLLHEARARISHGAGRRDEYYAHTRDAERWLRPTNNPLLIAKCERLWELSRYSAAKSPPPDPLDPASVEVTLAEGLRTETSITDTELDLD